MCKYNIDIFYIKMIVFYISRLHVISFLLFSIPCRSHCINIYRSTSFFLKVA